MFKACFLSTFFFILYLWTANCPLESLSKKLQIRHYICTGKCMLLWRYRSIPWEVKDGKHVQKTCDVYTPSNETLYNASNLPYPQPGTRACSNFVFDEEYFEEHLTRKVGGWLGGRCVTRWVSVLHARSDCYITGSCITRQFGALHGTTVCHTAGRIITRQVGVLHCRLLYYTGRWRLGVGRLGWFSDSPL